MKHFMLFFLLSSNLLAFSLQEGWSSVSFPSSGAVSDVLSSEYFSGPSPDVIWKLESSNWYWATNNSQIRSILATTAYQEFYQVSKGQSYSVKMSGNSTYVTASDLFLNQTEFHVELSGALYTFARVDDNSYVFYEAVPSGIKTMKIAARGAETFYLNGFSVSETIVLDTDNLVNIERNLASAKTSFTINFPSMSLYKFSLSVKGALVLRVEIAEDDIDTVLRLKAGDNDLATNDGYVDGLYYRGSGYWKIENSRFVYSDLAAKSNVGLDLSPNSNTYVSIGPEINNKRFLSGHAYMKDVGLVDMTGESAECVDDPDVTRGTWFENGNLHGFACVIDLRKFMTFYDLPSGSLEFPTQLKEGVNFSFQKIRREENKFIAFYNL